MLVRIGSILLASLTALAMLAAVDVRAQTIQLPSFHSFGVDTTVVVPDSGAAYAARDRRASYGTGTFGGAPRNRGWGISLNAPGVGVTAQIHDPQAREQALAPANQRRTGAIEGGRMLRSQAGEAAVDSPLAGVAELQRQRAAEAVARQHEQASEAAALVEKARRAQAAGKTSLAATYYRLAAAKATGPLKQQIEVERRPLQAVRPTD